VDKGLEERMQLAQDISSLILSIRKKVNIKVRQPLQRVLIPVTNPDMEEQIRQVDELIRNEVNVKSIEYLTDTEGFIKKKIKPNFKMLGARLGAKMKGVAALITNLSQTDIARLEREGRIDLSYENETVAVSAAEVDIIAEDVPGWSVTNKDTLTVALDITLTPELVQEGLAREFVNRIQKLRKDESYELTDRIIVSYESYEPLDLAIMGFQQYICAEILADNITSLPGLTGGHVVDLNNVHLNVLISKIS
jgi:isoleucyl-tRNA synthetase